jgi:hypothetical protein
MAGGPLIAWVLYAQATIAVIAVTTLWVFRLRFAAGIEYVLRSKVLWLALFTLTLAVLCDCYLILAFCFDERAMNEQGIMRWKSALLSLTSTTFCLSILGKGSGRMLLTFTSLGLTLIAVPFWPLFVLRLGSQP